jgi:hypothetical protein
VQNTSLALSDADPFLSATQQRLEEPNIENTMVLGMSLGEIGLILGVGAWALGAKTDHI